MHIVDEKSFKVLLATENQTFRNNLGQKLRFEGFDVEFATGGFHILHLLEYERDYNLIIIHENMHDMPAFEIVSLIRTTRTKLELPIIFISKDQKEETVVEMIQWGANDFVVQSTNLAPIAEKTKKYFQTAKNS